MLAPITLPRNYNYIGVFLTLDCNLGCSYCINRYGDLCASRPTLAASEWVAGLNRIISRSDLPLTLQGGEPTLHPGFPDIVNGITAEHHIDLLTNLETDINLFMRNIPPQRLRRSAPYASIRVSYHPEVMRIEPLAAKVCLLLGAGYSVGIWGVLHPEWQDKILAARDYCVAMGIDFRTKEFLGVHHGELFGQLSYPEACAQGIHPNVECRTTELLIGPSGHIYRCHSDLYAERSSIGHILDPELTVTGEFRSCSAFGSCNPCDVKLKTNRFQEFGHTSVEIRFEGEVDKS